MSNIVKATRKPTVVDAVQFTGKNGQEVREFLSGHGLAHRLGGGWVKVWDVLGFGEEPVTVRKTEWIVLEGESASIYSDGGFAKNFKIKK